MSYTQSATSWQPETYAEMGAAVPFTSPELTGARARLGARGLELTLPNPAGKRGVYILEPREVNALCEPTIHDDRLLSALGELPLITPASMRKAAREVAEAGYAGRAAAAAARRAQQEDRGARASAQHEILRRLVPNTAEAGHDVSAREQAVNAALAGLSARTGHRMVDLVEAIGAAADLAAPAGQTGSADARYPALLAEIEAMGRAVNQEIPPPRRLALGRAGKAASLVLSTARDSIILARRALAGARECLDTIRATPAEIAALRSAVLLHMSRLDWLLDGWAPLGHVWRLAAPGRKCAALNEMGLMVPTIPVEAACWFGVPVQETQRQGLREAVAGSADWRSFGLVHDLLLRNEAIRAATL